VRHRAEPLIDSEQVIPVLLLPIALLLASEIQTGAAPEFHQPQLAAAFGQVGITYGAGSSLYFASSSDNGQTFSPRVKVAESGALALGRHRGPRLTILRDTLLITAVAGAEVSKAEHAHGLPEKGELIAWRSTDHGKTWQRASVINDVPGSAEEGLHAIVAEPNGAVFAVWLDHRTPGTKLYGARSTDGGRTWNKNVLVYASPDGTICQCCDPSLAIGPAGEIEVMWRNVIDGSRDLYLASSRDGIHFTAQKLGNDTWKLDACPMDGGGLAVDHGQIVSAWRRGSEVFLAKPGQPEQLLGTGKDITITATSKGTFVAWATDKGIQTLTPGASAPTAVAPQGSFPNLTALPDGSALLAWEDNGAIKTRKLD
jgi:hypothetical protein